MTYFERVRSDMVLRSTLVLAILCVLANSPVAAAGLKDRIKGALGKDKTSETEAEIARLSADKETAAQEGMRSVLLVSSPRHNAPIADNSTIAFIEFNHIAHRIVSDPEKDVCAAQIAAALAQHLADLNRFKVVTRDLIGSVLEEQSFANSGSVNSSTAARLGELIGADILIYGQVQLCVSDARSWESGAPGPQGVGGAGQQPNLTDILKDAAVEKIGSEVLGSGLPGNILSSAINRIRSGKSEDAENALDAKPAKSKTRRSLVLAQVQLIESGTGRQIFTTSLEGQFEDEVDEKDAFGAREHELLISRAADDLANSFIDDFLARREAHYIGLYDDPNLGSYEAIELIQLGDCESAERSLSGIYPANKYNMSNEEIAKLMYNHGIALMCSNRSEEALARLWASLRLSNIETTFEAIKFANDTVDRGRNIMSEGDSIIKDVRSTVYPASSSP